MPQRKHKPEEIVAIQQNGVVSRKIVAIVVEHFQIEHLDFRVGGVDIHRIDGAGAQLTVRHVVIAETGPPSGAM